MKPGAESVHLTVTPSRASTHIATKRPASMDGVRCSQVKRVRKAEPDNSTDDERDVMDEVVEGDSNHDAFETGACGTCSQIWMASSVRSTQEVKKTQSKKPEVNR